MTYIKHMNAALVPRTRVKKYNNESSGLSMCNPRQFGSKLEFCQVDRPTSATGRLGGKEVRECSCTP